MDEVERLIEEFRARANSPAVSKLDVLLDLERLRDPRIVPFLLEVLGDSKEPAAVRIYIVKRLRNGRPNSGNRAAVARAIIELLAKGSSPELRLQAALALAEFTHFDRIPYTLGRLALDVTEPLDLRYSAFTSLERVGPTPECVDILRQLSADETLGNSARSLLASWQVE